MKTRAKKMCKNNEKCEVCRGWDEVQEAADKALGILGPCKIKVSKEAAKSALKELLEEKK